MREASSPTVRRKELGIRLRDLRHARGWTVEQVADRMLCSASKVSRLETGQRGASARDIRDLCDLYEVEDDEREELASLARQGKEKAWWQPLNLRYSTYVGLEAEAESILDFGVGIVPGLLQTADYARAVVRAIKPTWVPHAVERRVTGRIERQQILAGPNPPRFDAVMDESALYRVVGSPAVMAEQLERLVEVSELPHVTLRVIPCSAGALPAMHKFIILASSARNVPDMVYLEGLTDDAFIEDVPVVEVYRTTFGALSELAATADRTRAMIAAMITDYRAIR